MRLPAIRCPRCAYWCPFELAVAGESLRCDRCHEPLGRECTEATAGHTRSS